MKDQKETRQKLLACAKKEFMEKGYSAASLRSICKQAEVTTGALYFFFANKADLFSALVEEPVNCLYEIMMTHYREEDELDMSQVLDWRVDNKDLQAAIDSIHYVYQHYDEFQLVLTKSQGSGYENCVERFVEITQQHYRKLADRLCRQRNRPLLDDYTIHWMAHMHMDTFVHMFTHEKSEEAAYSHARNMVSYLTCGFFGMLNYGTG